MNTPNDQIRQRTEALMNQGFQLLEEEEFEQALEVAKELEELRFTAAFEIAALAHDGMDNIDEAVRVLHRGVEAAPDCWPNWQLLGNYLSDQERYEEAEAAYEQALQCDNVWEGSVRLNQAILAGRQGRHEQTLELLEQADDPELVVQVTARRIAALKHVGRTDEAVTHAEEFLAKYGDNKEHGKSLARVAALLGELRLEGGHDQEELREFAWMWLQAHPNSEPLLTLLRDLDGQFAGQVHYYWLFLHATIPQDHPWAAEAVGYFVSYGVIAEHPEEALEYARRFEDDDIAPHLEIEEIEEVEEVDPSEPKGVCRRTGRSFYEDEE